MPSISTLVVEVEARFWWCHSLIHSLMVLLVTLLLVGGVYAASFTLVNG